ncbi:hypothetical protein ABD77_00820 [Brevibacillus formosus]|nr:hypothetical protein [Brevibacillus formosus]
MPTFGPRKLRQMYSFVNLILVIVNGYNAHRYGVLRTFVAIGRDYPIRTDTYSANKKKKRHPIQATFAF